MTSIPAPAVPRRSYQIGHQLGTLLALIPFGVALATGTVWVLLLAALLLPRRR